MVRLAVIGSFALFALFQGAYTAPAADVDGSVAVGEGFVRRIVPIVHNPLN